jgi:hypothetical protein
VSDVAGSARIDGSKTKQYAGLNIKTEFTNGAMFMVGGALGLTGESQDAIFRAILGVEFD